MWDPAADVGEEEWRCFAYGDAVSFSTFGGAASQEPPAHLLHLHPLSTPLRSSLPAFRLSRFPRPSRFPVAFPVVGMAMGFTRMY